LLAIGIMVLLAQYVMPSFKGFQRFVLQGGEQVGYTATEPGFLPALGSEGEVFATLRPGGKVMIKDTIYDAVSSGAYLERGTKVKVVRTEGNTLIVDVIEALG
jgi:membrane-bound serine protease (ClpP class)